ncbi:Tuberculostearic acid methyltransferase UfaA1 [BD1-7 clade bacterium]|uniref:Tuberculostearic acid methyltransferase UfaA1 n=1 Tax=BD1-7 clade bacterium TaxID=2029982 RepID=A0A5S9PME1_9GAMM|nr:Tuberculostearic acid methyltransferase UfaA1 [BD1-7 clade bacterium]CAA0105621.1 Tuberculostearic acid methyltransferase UfaA1 [BD1-7 clade bacterium]
MTSAKALEQTLSSRTKPSLWDDIAYKQLISHFSRITQGRIVIRFENDTHESGQNQHDAAVTAVIQVHDKLVFRHIMLSGIVGAAEMYMLGKWSTPDLVSVIRVMCLNLNILNQVNQQQSLIRKSVLRFARFVNRNTLEGSRKNISAHYDLGNDFFQVFLDKSMMYSAAIYLSENTALPQASIHKLDLICRKLQLQPSDHLVEIGTGWGGMAIHAATHYGCHVTTTTISQRQYDYAKSEIERLGLQDKITLLLKDYRELTGTYDKLVSIEMIEAVGHEYYDSYFKTCSSLLKPEGVALIQAITIDDQRFEASKKSLDFIQRYIFPGGCLPSNEVISRYVSQATDMHIYDLHDITQDYARTLHDWRQAFLANIDQVKAMGFDDVFCRMWEYYLAYCEGGFTEQVIHTAQFVMAKPQARHLKSLRM